MFRTIEFKLYPTKAQAATLDEWLRTCCWTYNQMLEQRSKAWKRRGESSSLYSQYVMLTTWRARMPRLASCPADFLRGALRRVDVGMKGFFRRVKAGETPGFPRFRASSRFNSIEFIAMRKFFGIRGRCFVPGIGQMRMRCGRQKIAKPTQRLLRIIRRASGWYGQIRHDEAPPPLSPVVETGVGIDVGLTTFATLSNGEKIENPRWGRRSARKLRAIQRCASRKQKGSRNRRKAIRRTARVHERVAAQRKDFCHQQSRKIVNRFGLIAVEDLKIARMARGHFAKSILDAAWSIFTTQLAYKAENAGRQFVKVDARCTSQTCECGASVPKALGDRVHSCASCGVVLDRDHMAARVILQRALAGSSRPETPVEIGALATGIEPVVKLRSVKQEGSISEPPPPH